MNNIELTVALATSPSTAFADLRERPRFWFPLLLLVLTTAGLAFWYYSVVDIEWFKDLMYGNNPNIQALPEDQRAQAMGMVGRNTLRWGSVASLLVFMPAVMLLGALYLWIAAKITKLPLGFRHWFSLTCWSSLPMLLGTVIAAIMLMLSDTNQISPGVLQPLSLNELLLHRPIGSPGQSLFDSLSIPTFLGFALMIIGLRVWSGRSWAFSATVALLPWVVIYGVWSFFTFR